MIHLTDKAKDYPWGNNKWKVRTEFIAKLIPFGSSVLDLGGGLCHLEPYLLNCKYTSVDLEKWAEETIVADLGAKELPEIKAHQYIVAQGVLEYIPNGERFLRNIRKYGQVLILTNRRWEKNDWRDIPRVQRNFGDVSRMLKVSGWKVMFSRVLSRSKGLPIEKVMICRRIDES